MASAAALLSPAQLHPHDRGPGRGPRPALATLCRSPPAGRVQLLRQGGRSLPRGALPRRQELPPRGDETREPMRFTATDSAGVTILRFPSPIEGALLDVVQAVTALPPQASRDLILLGAVYCGEARDGWQSLRWRRAALLSPSDPCALYIAKGQWVRVHPSPKRFPEALKSNWRGRLLLCSNSYVAVDKPPGVPSMPHESNMREAAPACLAQLLGKDGSLQPCHRLDVWTSGVLVLGLCSEATRELSEAMQSRDRVRKYYKALTSAPVPLGRISHHMFNGPFGTPVDVAHGEALPRRGPRLLSRDPLPGWKPCELQVLDCREVDFVPLPYSNHLGEAPCRVYEVLLLLLTGRSHQIRAQLAAAGAPILGDSMYQPLCGLEVGEDRKLPLSRHEVANVLEASQSPDSPLGLHAWKLLWEEHFTLVAPAPWDPPAC